MADGSDTRLVDQQMKQIKSIIVGDQAIGKTCYYITYTTEPFPDEYVPTEFGIYSKDVLVEDQQIHLELWDTSGRQEFRKLRPLSYPKTDVFVICFSLVAPTSLENVKNLWVPEVKEHSPGTPYILVGLKSDLRDQFAQNADEFSAKGWEPVPASKAEEIQKATGARGYVECSAKLGYNLNEVFDVAVKAVLHPEAAGSAEPVKAD
jgi:small GTP-binding protein